MKDGAMETGALFSQPMRGEMKLRPFIPAQDWAHLKRWVGDERTHALWCANRFAYPLTEDNLRAVLEKDAQEWGGSAYTVMEDERPVGFFVYSANPAERAGFLKFVILDPVLRGRGYGTRMMRLALSHAFERTGVSKVRLMVFDGNEAARACYRKAGFVEESRTPDAFSYRDERWARCCMAASKKPFV